MAVNNLMTLPEYAKGFSNEDIRRNIIEMFTQYSDIFEVMPFEGLRGSKYVGYREAALAQPQFRAVNESSSTGHGIIQPFDEATAIVDHDIDIDRAIVDRHGPERRNYEERMGITAFARLWVDTFVKGDRSTNPRVFDGLNVRANFFGRLFTNSGASGGGSAVTASLYVMTLGEGMLRGIYVRNLTPEDVGLLQDRKTFRTHISWDVSIVDEHKYCFTRLSSWTNAPIVA